MSIESHIENTDKYYITAEGDVICSMNNVTTTVNYSIDDDICNSIEITKQVVKDVVVLKSTPFVEKYKDSLKPKAPLSVSGLYRRMREFIVDNEVPISDHSKAKSTKQPSTTNESTEPRRTQVERLLGEGVTDLKEISEKLNMNISYVRTVMKKIKDDLKAQENG